MVLAEVKQSINVEIMSGLGTAAGSSRAFVLLSWAGKSRFHMGLPKSPSQLYKRGGTTVLTIALPGFSHPLCNSWSQTGHTKKEEMSTAHVHYTACRWYLFKALEELKQCTPLSTVLCFGSHEKAVWQYEILQHLDNFMYSIITYIIKYMLCPMTSADCTGQAQTKDQPRTPACGCTGMESHPFPVPWSQEPHALGSQVESEQKPSLSPPPVRAESLKMRNGDLNAHQSVLRPLDSQTSALHCSRLPLPTVFPGKWS